MAKPRTFICVHTVKQHGVYLRPGAEIELEDNVEVERLLAAGAIATASDFADMQWRTTSRLAAPSGGERR